MIWGERRCSVQYVVTGRLFDEKNDSDRGRESIFSVPYKSTLRINQNTKYGVAEHTHPVRMF